MKLLDIMFLGLLNIASTQKTFKTLSSENNKFLFVLQRSPTLLKFHLSLFNYKDQILKTCKVCIASQQLKKGQNKYCPLRFHKKLHKSFPSSTASAFAWLDVFFCFSLQRNYSNILILFG